LRPKIRWGATALVSVAALMLTACGSGDAEDAPADEEEVTEEVEEEEPADEEEPAEEEASGTDTFIVGIGQDLPILDGRLPGGSAASFSALRHIMEPLVFFDAQGNMQGVLAESWEQVEPTRWRFTLREGVTFHNGEPFNSESVVTSIADAVDPDFTPWFRFATGSVLESAEAVDEYTVDIITQSENPDLPNVLTVVDMVAPGHHGEEQNENPVGTGPFVFESFEPRASLNLTRNDDYWGELPEFETLTFRILPEASTRVQALLAGEVQVINNISPEDITRLEEDAGTQVVSSNTTRHIMIALRHDQEPLDDKLIREAMNYAVDKEGITSSILAGIAAPAPGILAETLPSSLTDLGPWPYDPDRARELLEEAGYDGEEITIAIGAGRYPNDDQVGQAVVAQLEEVGFNIDLQAVDFTTMSAEVGLREESSYDAWLQGWGATLLDSIGMLEAFFGGEEAALPLFYDNADYNAAIDSARAATDPEERGAFIEEAQRIAWEDAGGLFLYFPVDNLGVSANVTGMEARFDEFFFVFPGVTVD
jgi:peptide/nickel transport system substrate-binding protein